MFRYIKSDIDLNKVKSEGLESMWNNYSDRQDIIKEIEKLPGKDIVEKLENYLDDDRFKEAMLMLASAVTEEK